MMQYSRNVAIGQYGRPFEQQSQYTLFLNTWLTAQNVTDEENSLLVKLQTDSCDYKRILFTISKPGILVIKGKAVP